MSQCFVHLYHILFFLSSLYSRTNSLHTRSLAHIFSFSLRECVSSDHSRTEPGGESRTSTLEKLLEFVPSVCVFITAGPSTKLFAWGGGGYGRYYSYCVSRMCHVFLPCVCEMVQGLFNTVRTLLRWPKQLKRRPLVRSLFVVPFFIW
jgi:hypothetical protein